MQKKTLIDEWFSKQTHAHALEFQVEKHESVTFLVEDKTLDWPSIDAETRSGKWLFDQTTTTSQRIVAAVYTVPRV